MTETRSGLICVSCVQQVLRDSDKEEPQLLPNETVQDLGRFSLRRNHSSNQNSSKAKQLFPHENNHRVWLFFFLVLFYSSRCHLLLSFHRSTEGNSDSYQLQALLQMHGQGKLREKQAL